MDFFLKSSLVIKFVISAIATLSFPAQIVAQQKTSYSKQIEIVYNNIFQHFYDSSRNLFIEKKPLKPDEKPYSYLWPLCALIQAANEREVLEPQSQYMKPVIQVINKYYNKSKPPHPGYESYLMEAGGDGRFYDDNQWIGITYMDAYNRTNDSLYLNLATEIYGFMMTGFDTLAGGGLYWKEFDETTKNTCSNGPGILLALQLYNATHQNNYLDTAILLYEWVNNKLKSPDGLFFDHIKLPSREIDKRKYTYNTGTMLQSNVLLYKITNNKKYLNAAQQQAAASLKFFYKKNLFPDNYWFNAVLFRGYMELYKVDKRKKYIAAFKSYANQVWNKQRDTNNFIGTENIKTLIDQAAYVEIIARLQSLK